MFVYIQYYLKYKEKFLVVDINMGVICVVIENIDMSVIIQRELVNGEQIYGQ